MQTQRRIRTRLLRLTEEEIEYFVLRVQTSSKARPEVVNTPRARTPAAINAAWASLRARRTCAPFARGIALMDHSDDGIRKLVERSGITWVEPEKRRLSTGERLLAAALAFGFVLTNWAAVHRAVFAGPNPIDLGLARDRLLSGSGCFARFLAQSHLGRNAWTGLFVTGDVSFLRMFACFAASRTGRPIGVYLRHRMPDHQVMPIAVNRLFTMDPGASRNFSPMPADLVIEPRPVRLRKPHDGEALDVGIVTDNFVSLESVWELARECALQRNIKSVRIRLHPGSPVRDLPPGLPPSVNLEDNREELSAFAERIDFALVSMSSAVPLLQELLVPCFHARHLYRTDDRWKRNRPEWEVDSRYPVPEMTKPLDEFLNPPVADMLSQEIESLRNLIANGQIGNRGSTTLLRNELKSFLGR